MLFRHQEPEKIQPIFNDLFDGEYILLIDLITTSCGHSKFSLSIRYLLEDGVFRLLQKVTQNPKTIQKNYFTEIKLRLKPYFVQQFQDIHLRTLLKLENHESLKAAFSDPKIHDMTREKNTFYDTLINEVVLMQSVYSNLYNLSRGIDFVGWKYYFILINQFLTDNPQIGYTGRMKCKRNKLKKIMDFNCFFFIPDYLRDIYKESKTCPERFFQMMLIAKCICKNQPLVMGTYREWYKLNIVDIKYRYKTEGFTKVMGWLNEMGQLENDPEIIQIHIDTPIPAPPNCNEMVLDYKEFLRVRLSELQGTSTVTNENLSMSFDEELKIN